MAFGLDALVIVVNDVQRLRGQKATFEQVFSGNEELLKRNAPITFKLLQVALLESMIMGVNRILIDPAEQRGNDNLGLEKISSQIPGDTKHLEVHRKEIQGKYRHFKQLRHKVIGHRDEPTAYAVAFGETSPVDDAEFQQLFEAIDEIGYLLDEVESHIRKETEFPIRFGIDKALNRLDGDVLINVLKEAVK